MKNHPQHYESDIPSGNHDSLRKKTALDTSRILKSASSFFPKKIQSMLKVISLAAIFSQGAFADGVNWDELDEVTISEISADEQKKYEIFQDKLQKELHDQEIGRAVLSGAGGIFVLGILAVYMTRDKRSKKRHKKMLIAKQNDLDKQNDYIADMSDVLFEEIPESILHQEISLATKKIRSSHYLKVVYSTSMYLPKNNPSTEGFAWMQQELIEGSSAFLEFLVDFEKEVVSSGKYSQTEADVFDLDYSTSSLDILRYIVSEAKTSLMNEEWRSRFFPSLSSYESDLNDPRDYDFSSDIKTDSEGTSPISPEATRKDRGMSISRTVLIQTFRAYLTSRSITFPHVSAGPRSWNIDEVSFSEEEKPLNDVLISTPRKQLGDGSVKFQASGNSDTKGTKHKSFVRKENQLNFPTTLPTPSEQAKPVPIEKTSFSSSSSGSDNEKRKKRVKFSANKPEEDIPVLGGDVGGDVTQDKTPKARPGFKKKNTDLSGFTRRIPVDSFHQPKKKKSKKVQELIKKISPKKK